MKVGFTGTRAGMSGAQKATVRRLLAEWLPKEVHHGDCVGADDEFADLCAELVPLPRIVAHPGTSATGGSLFRACNPHSVEVRPVRNYYARNRNIVGELHDAGDLLIATPQYGGRRKTGGTWYTVDYAYGAGKRVIIVWPDGSTADNAGTA